LANGQFCLTKHDIKAKNLMRVRLTH